MKKPRLSAILNITTVGAGYIYNNAERKLLGWGLLSAWGVSIAERFMFHSPIEKATPLTYIYPSIALLAFAIDAYMEARKINKKESETITGKIINALKGNK